MQAGELQDGDKPSKRSRQRAAAASPASKPRRVSARAYTKADKVRACTAALTANVDHPYSDVSVQAARDTINAPGLSKETLFNWMTECRDQVLGLMLPQQTTAEIVSETQESVLADMVAVRNMAIERLKRPDGKLNEASARDLAVIMGISQDHIHKLHKLSAERTARVYALIAACDRAHWDYDTFIEDMIVYVESKIQQASLSISIEADSSTDV